MDSTNVDILLSAIVSDKPSSRHALYALSDISDNKPNVLIDYRRNFIDLLNSRNVFTRSISAQIIGQFGDQQSISLIAERLITTRKSLLFERDPESSAGDYLSRYFENLFWGITINKCFEAADSICEIILDKRTDDDIRGYALGNLANVLEYIDDPCLIPKQCGNLARKHISHRNPEISEGAYSLIGQLTLHNEHDDAFQNVSKSYVSRTKRTPTPARRLRPNRGSLSASLSDHIDDSFSRIHPEDFEHLMTQMLEVLGWSTEKTVYTGDRGVDIIAAGKGIRIAVQCKRIDAASAVGNAVITQIAGAKELYKCNKALVITTGRISTPAKQTAADLGVELWDGAYLRDIVISKVLPRLI